jgi:hypothetical protein
LYNGSFIFRLSPGIISQGYDDSRANAEHKIPVHIIVADTNQHGPVVPFEKERQTEQPNVQLGGVKATPQVEHELGSSDVSKLQKNRGDSNGGIEDEHLQNPHSLTSSFNSKPSETQIEHHHTKLNHDVHKINSEDVSNNNYTKPSQQFDKTQSKDIARETNSESNGEVKPLNSENNASKKQDLSTEKHLPEHKSGRKEIMLTDSQTSTIKTEVSSGRVLKPSSTRQLINPFENPILTYLTKRQSLDVDSNNLDKISTKNNADTPQNIRREIFQQQTIIRPNPYLHRFLQQQHHALQTNPAYYQGQYPTAQQQDVSSHSNTQFLSYPAQAQSPSNMPHTFHIFHGQGNQNVVDSDRTEVPHFSSNTENSGNLVTFFTLNPAIASVTHTVPATGVTGISSAPPQLSTYPTQANLPYMPSFTQTLFHGAPSPANLPNTRLIYNGPQPSSRLQWPLADYFPIVIKDPFLSMYNMVTSMIEYGPEADVCKKTKNFRQGKTRSLLPGEDESVTKLDDEIVGKVLITESGGWKEVGEDGNPFPMERKVSEDVTREDKEKSGDEKKGEEERKKKDDSQNTEVIMETGGNGNGGPYITRLMVRKGGVSIAGPGGIATAGSGGTAIVGPGGVAYTSPNGLAVVGPGGKVVGLPSGVDFSVSASNSNTEGSTPRFFHIPPGGKVVATGPVVYFHPPE